MTTFGGMLTGILIGYCATAAAVSLFIPIGARVSRGSEAREDVFAWVQRAREEQLPPIGPVGRALAALTAPAWLPLLALGRALS